MDKKNILIGITGGIAAYKTLELIRKFIKAGYNVKTIPTPFALNFVTVLSLKTLSKNQVYQDNIDFSAPHIEHISLSDWADCLLITPCTANTLSKISSGIADNLLTTTVLSLSDEKPLIICPAMNTKMWEKKIIRKNISIIKENYPNANIIDPRYGDLACGEKGIGTLASLELIFETTLTQLNEKK